MTILKDYVELLVGKERDHLEYSEYCLNEWLPFSLIVGLSMFYTQVVIYWSVNVIES